MLETITSIKDERVTLARDIKSRRGRQQHKRILLEGEEILDWAIEHTLAIEYILVSSKELANITQKYPPSEHKIFVVSEGILKKITDTSYVIPVVGIAQIPEKKDFDIPKFVVVLDAVQDFGNIGTIIRTCQAFGIHNLVSTTSDTDIYNRKTIEASRGSAFSTHLDVFPNPLRAIEYLKEEGFKIVATSPRGIMLQSLLELEQQPIALVIGNETLGVSPEVEKQADFLLQIPMQLEVESLNVGVATGISIYEIKLKQVLAMLEKLIKSTLGRELSVTGMLERKALDMEIGKVSAFSSQQVVFMMVLKCDKTMLIEDMCKQFSILEYETDKFLESLLTFGLIVIDNREIKLTDKGEEVLAKLWFIVERTEEMLLSDFSPEEIKVLKKQLYTIQEKSLQVINGN